MVVTSFGSSADPIGAGSTYLRVVRSGKTISLRCSPLYTIVELTFPLVNLHVYQSIQSKDDQVRCDVPDTDKEKSVWVVERNSLGHLHHSENNDQVGSI